MTKKAQFMLVATILITISLFIIYTYIRSADTSSIIFFEPTSKEQFVNLHTSITDRNAWLSNYWWNLNWQNRSTFLVSGSGLVQVDPQITTGDDCFNQVRVTDSNNNEIPSSVTATNAPCNVEFTASTGTYQVYWNNPLATAPLYRAIVPVGAPIPPTRKESAPTQLFCPHIVDLYKKAGVDINCSVQNIFSNNQVNYSIQFQSLDISFDGFLS